MHMNPAEAVRAHLHLHSQSSIGIHFGLIETPGELQRADARLDKPTAPRRRASSLLITDKSAI
jgi:hypothetical protein